MSLQSEGQLRPSPDTSIADSSASMDWRRHSRELLGQFIDAHPDSTAVLAQDGTIVLVNRAWTNTARERGISHQAACRGCNYLHLCQKAQGPSAAGADDAARGIERVLAGQADSFSMEYSADFAGSKAWGRLRATKIEYRDTRWVVVSHEDVTERNLMLESLLVGEQRYRNIFRKSTDTLIVLDTDGRIVDVNPTACEMLGYTYAELTQLSGRDIVHPDYLHLFDLFMKTYANSAKFPIEAVDIRADGTLVNVEVTGAVLDYGDSPKLLAIIHDITERKRIERQQAELVERIQAAQKLESLAAMAGGIAHDFNNLLVAILGNAELTLREMPADAPEQPQVQEIHRAALRAAELTNQMLAYSGKGQLLIKSIDLNDLIDHMHDVLDIAIAKQAKLQFDLAGTLPPVEADADQLRQVVVNIATNAAEAVTDTRGQITIRTFVVDTDGTSFAHAGAGEAIKAGRYVCLEVADTGCGMDTETLKKVFEPFFTTKFTGRGLGLAAALGIVRGHRGTIDIKSTPGSGSSVRILLPAQNQEARPTATPGAREPMTDYKGTGTILVIDDEEAVRKLTRLMLAQFGFDVLTAGSGAEGVEMFAHHADDIVAVLLDRTMPGMTGGEVFKQIREIKADAKIILCSGYAEQQAMSEFPPEQLAGFLQKPFQLNSLLQTVRDVLATPTSP